MVKQIKSMVTLCYDVISKVQYTYYFEKLQRRFVMRLIRYERDSFAREGRGTRRDVTALITSEMVQPPVLHV